MTLGDFGYQRAIAADFLKLGSDSLTYAMETEHTDGPWDVPENYKKYNAFMRYSTGTEAQGWDITGTGYEGDWNGTNQIPERAVDEGIIDRFGSLNPSDGGKEYRWSLAVEWRGGDSSFPVTVQAYYLRSGFPEVWIEPGNIGVKEHLRQ